jgi:hypothetical protein
MSIRENTFNALILTDGDMSGNLETDVIDTSRLDAVVFYAKFTGSPVGTLKVQVSIDDINYVDLPDSEVSVTAAGDFMWNIVDTNFDKIKVVYTATSGSGTINIRANTKGEVD